jgi:regulator of sigma E protease
MIVTIIAFIFILGFLVFVHEFGHFILAKKLGVKVEEFAIGFPPTIWKKKVGETVYSINIIPLGGFNKLLGEGKDKHLDNPRSFSAQPPHKRAAIILGGVAMNFLVASLIFYFILASGGFQLEFPLIFDYEFPFGDQRNYPPVVSFVSENSPAEEAGIEVNDFVVRGNGVEFKNTNHLIGFLSDKGGEEVDLVIKKSSNDEIKEVSVVPRENPPEGEGAVGIALMDMTNLVYEKPLSKLTSGFTHSLNLAHYSLVGLGHYIKMSVVQRDVEPIANSVTGPVGVLALTKLSVEAGFTEVIFLIAVISIALFLVNILPIPPLDGGIFLFLLFEMVTGKKIPKKMELITQQVGIIFFIVLFILVTFKDILQFKDILFKGFL